MKSRWILVCGDKHTPINDFQVGVHLLDSFISENPGEVARLMTYSEYQYWEGKKTKRGKRS